MNESKYRKDRAFRLHCLVLNLESRIARRNDVFSIGEGSFFHFTTGPLGSFLANFECAQTSFFDPCRKDLVAGRSRPGHRRRRKGASIGSAGSHESLMTTLLDSLGKELTFRKTLLRYFGERKANGKVLEHVHLVLASIHILFHIIHQSGGCSAVARRGVRNLPTEENDTAPIDQGTPKRQNLRASKTDDGRAVLDCFGE